ncbi:MAG: 30S ribosomal protein S1 [Treponemataceae bacterium]
MIITIDGPAGCGKSTVAKILAERFGLFFLNTGNFYRAVSFAFIENFGGDFLPTVENEAEILEYAKTLKLEYEAERFFVNGVDVSEKLRTDEVEKIVAPVSAIIELRSIVNEKIRLASEGKKIICEGRDTGSVIFPNADVKFYLDASAAVRATRRFNQGTSTKTLAKIEADIIERDKIDKNKPVGKLKIPKGAIYLDTSHLTIFEVCDIMVKEIYSKGLFMDKLEVEKGTLENTDESTQTQLQLLKEYDVNPPETGLAKGRVVVVTDDEVFVDVGAKAEGSIPKEEFDEVPEVGEEIEVFVEKTYPLVISKEKADRAIMLKKIRSMIDSEEPINGKITKSVKGGFEVTLPGKLTAFLPTSQTDVQRINEPQEYIGLKAKFLVEKFSYDRRSKRENIVVNRRKYLEKLMEESRNKFFAEAKIGDTVKGIVKSFTSFGAFIDLGGFDGLLHINDMSWGHVTRPRDFVKKGQEIELKLVRLDPEEKRINLSLKHFVPDPWITFEDKFSVNDIVKGKVTKISDFGAFIELAEGIEGLAHISEFSWLKKINKPQEVVKEGDEVECMILGYDIQAGRVSLGLKQVKPNPWDEIDKLYPVGSVLKGKVVKLTNAGSFLQLQEGIDGFLHIDDLSWTKRIKHPSSELTVGDEIDVKVLESNPETRRIRLGVKQLSDNPWVEFSTNYSTGAFVEGEVTSITDFGVFVKIPGDIEGLIHKQNLVENSEEEPDEALKKYNVGDKVKAVVLDFNPKEKRIAFSVKDYKKRLQQAEVSKYMSDSKDENAGFTLGDMLKSKEK